MDKFCRICRKPFDPESDEAQKTEKIGFCSLDCEQEYDQDAEEAEWDAYDEDYDKE